MSVVSPSFAGFVVVTLVIYHCLPGVRRPAWLLVISAVFASLCAGRYVAVLALVSFGVTICAPRVAPGQSRRAVWLTAGCATVVGVLFALRARFHAEPFAAPFVVAGLSFYSLQAIAYLADVFRGRLGAARLADVALYLAYFPKFVAGPIERAPEFLARVARPRTIDDDCFAEAEVLIAIGMSRKLILADSLNALIPADVFTAPARYGAAALTIYLMSAGFALYNDFAGYTSIVRGVSLLFGIELSPNFAQPFFARSFAELWVRWHISLSLWLRDYIYLPISRALLRRDPRLANIPNLLLPPMAAMLASGVWHGTSLALVLWGGLQGSFLIAERALALVRHQPPPAMRPRPRQGADALLVFGLGTLAFAFFRMDAGSAIVCVGRMLRGAGGVAPDVRVVAFMVPSLWLDWRQLRHGADTGGFLLWKRPWRAAMAAAALLLCFLFGRQHPATPFVYQSF